MSLSHGRVSLPCSPCEQAEDGTKIENLLRLLGGVSERRKARGKFYSLAFLLASFLVAVLGGAGTFRQIADQVTDFPQELLGALGGRWCYFRRRYRTPSEKTVRKVLSGIDASQLDKVVGAWLREHAHRDSDETLCLAIDGKVLRGAWTDDDQQFTLFSAMIHREGITVAQVRVPPDTNEITQVKALLDPVQAGEDERVVVTMDAAHTQRDTAEYLAGNRGFDYVMTVKGNQPTLHQTIVDTVRPLVIAPPQHAVIERGHGRINQWRTWVTDATGIDFPHAQKIGCIRRDVYALDNVRISREYAWIIIGSPDTGMKITAEELHNHVRSHWGIENKSHYVRDTTWREDAHHVTAGNAAQAMATFRNTAASLLRMNGHQDIKRTTEWVCRDPRRALPMLIT